MKVEVTATNVAEFKPVDINLKISIDDISELAALAEDAFSFKRDSGIQDTDGVAYSNVVQKVLSKIFKSVISPAMEEGNKKV